MRKVAKSVKTGREKLTELNFPPPLDFPKANDFTLMKNGFPQNPAKWRILLELMSLSWLKLSSAVKFQGDPGWFASLVLQPLYCRWRNLLLSSLLKVWAGRTFWPLSESESSRVAFSTSLPGSILLCLPFFLFLLATVDSEWLEFCFVSVQIWELCCRFDVSQLFYGKCPKMMSELKSSVTCVHLVTRTRSILIILRCQIRLL